MASITNINPLAAAQSIQERSRRASAGRPSETCAQRA